MNDQELIGEILKGDQQAVQGLHERYVDRIFHYIYIQTNSYHDTEELLQDVFLKAANHLDSFEGEASFKTWIFRIARNTVIDYYRKQKNMKKSFAMEDRLLENFAGETEAAETIVLRNLHIDEVFERINQLPNHYRTVLHLRFIEDFSIKETAAIMGKTTPAVKSMQRRASKILSEEINLEVSSR